MHTSYKRFIAARVQRIWEVIASDTALPRWIPRLDEARAEPPGQAHRGQRLHLSFVLMASVAEVEREVTECVAPHYIRWSTVREVLSGRELPPSRRAHRAIRLDPAEGGIIAHMSITWNPLGPVDWLLSLLVARRTLHRECRQTLDNIARLALNDNRT